MAITSPCINVCVTDPDTDLCYGCSRTTKEIKDFKTDGAIFLRKKFDVHSLLESVFDSVESNPSIKTAEEIISDFKNLTFSYVVGLGGGSSLDVAKFVACKIKTRKILIPTTFGSGSEVTRISVLKVNGKKQSFHDDRLIADIAIVDPYFIYQTPEKFVGGDLF